MTPELAEHISLMAAPIYAAFLARAIATRVDNSIPAETLGALRRHALDQAMALWLDAVDYESSSP